MTCPHIFLRKTIDEPIGLYHCVRCKKSMIAVEGFESKERPWDVWSPGLM